MAKKPPHPNSSKESPTKRLGVWVLADQLCPTSHLISSLSPDEVIVCFIEPSPHEMALKLQKKKLVLVLSMLRHYAQELRERGFEVREYRLDDPETVEVCLRGSVHCLADFVQSNAVTTLRVMQASEYDENEKINQLGQTLPVPVEIIPNDLFMVDRHSFEEWYRSTSSPSMESFYEMRREQTQLLMEEGSPSGGKWNFDTENRVPPEGKIPVPDFPSYPPDEITKEVMATVDEWFPHHSGSTDGFSLPVTRSQAENLADDFINHRLKLFGMYQDAMLSRSHIVFHSRLSPYLNHGLLQPLELLHRVEEAYTNGEVPINSAEGYVRQVLGWREFIHGTYWRKMPEYRNENPLGLDAELPGMYQNGDTLLRCVKCVLNHSLDQGYTHHIERLMIIGNFALLIGVRPDRLIDWFRETYLDSADWATLPNVMGLLMDVDNGNANGDDSFGSKPYAASANYIGKMSDYCKGCYYKGKKRLGDKACPLNFLYWNFVGEYQDYYKNNSRMKNAIQMYRLKPKAEREMIETSSKKFLAKIHADGTDRKLKKTRT